MSLQALETAANDAVIVKERPISKRMQQVLTNLATKGVTQREAARLAGMSEYHLSRELKKPQIQVFIARKAREKMSVGLLKASERMVELVDCDALTTSFDASKLILAIGGVKPTADAQVSVNIDIKAGYVIDLTDSTKPAAALGAMTIEHNDSTSRNASD